MRGCRVVWWRHGSIVPCGRRGTRRFVCGCHESSGCRRRMAWPSCDLYRLVRCDRRRRAGERHRESVPGPRRTRDRDLPARRGCPQCVFRTERHTPSARAFGHSFRRRAYARGAQGSRRFSRSRLADASRIARLHPGAPCASRRDAWTSCSGMESSYAPRGRVRRGAPKEVESPLVRRSRREYPRCFDASGVTVPLWIATLPRQFSCLSALAGHWKRGLS